MMSFNAEVVWLSGLSGAGKSTLADALVSRLATEEYPTTRLDGDDLRRGVCSDLGFSPADRAENLRRAAHIALLLCRPGHLVVCSFVTPLNEDRRRVRTILGNRLVEVFVKTSLEECERRDPKGLYRRARRGEIPDFTGVSAPFEEPEHPDVVLETERCSVEESVDRLLNHLRLAPAR